MKMGDFVYTPRFYTPEMFWGMDGHIVCLPLEIS